MSNRFLEGMAEYVLCLGQSGIPL